MSRRIVLCADDYGQDEAVSAGIAALAGLGRISATSCMASSNYWPQAAPLIKGFRGRIDVGLHFTLGIDPALEGGAYAGLGALVVAAYLRRLKRERIEETLERQLDRFEQAIGSPPDFIDGHQHVHQLPVVRDALLAVYERRLRRHAPYIRSAATIARRPSPVKSLIVRGLGASTLARRMDALGIPHNREFAGVYRFGAGDYRQLMRGWLAAAHDGSLIMCHPGRDSARNPRDPIGASRDREYRYFAGDDFAADLREYNALLVRGCELPSYAMYPPRIP